MLPATIGHVSTETTIGIYSHIINTMQQQVAVKIDRHIGGTNAEIPKAEEMIMVEQSCPKSSRTDTKCANLEREELWYGKINPSQQTQPDGRSASELTEQIVEKEEELAPLLSDEAKETLDQMREKQLDL